MPPDVDARRSRGDDEFMSTGTARRILVLANETLAGSGVLDEVSRHADADASDVLVIAPRLAKGRLSHFFDGDAAEARDLARQRLEETVVALRERGFDAHGDVGDPNPLLALLDAAWSFGPEVVIISTHPPERSQWMESRIVAKARQRLAMPVHHIIVDVEEDSLSADRDPRARGDETSEPLVTLYSLATYEEAMSIREQGFVDSHIEGEVGVPLLDREEGSDEHIVFAVDAPARVLTDYESSTTPSGSRQFMVPAALVNSLGPAVVISEEEAE